MDPRIRVEPHLPAGFRDLSPADMILKRHILSLVTAVFERFGFEPFSSSAVQFLSVLFGEEELAEMAFFRVHNTRRRDKVGRDATGLKYDQTVPLGRYVAEHYEELPRPFLRYEIGEAYRGETPAAARFCGFTQCDIDAVFAPGMLSDAQIIALMDACMNALGVSTHVVLLNNRKILDGLPQRVGFPERYLPSVLNVLDKKDKLADGETLDGELSKLKLKDENGDEFAEALLDAGQIFTLLEFCNVTGSNQERLAATRTFLGTSPISQQGCDELEEIMRFLALFGVNESRIRIEPSMVRGLGYYTGPIFETILTDSPETGSIFSGGRYDNLIDRFVEMPAPATGAGFGIDRFMVYAKERGLFTLPQSVVQVLVAYQNQNCLTRAIEVAAYLRTCGMKTMLYDGAEQGFRPQLGRAKMLGIPWTVLIGGSEVASGQVTTKNMASKVQLTMDLAELYHFLTVS